VELGEYVSPGVPLLPNVQLVLRNALDEEGWLAD
jgi:hypothetical protein